MADMSEYTHGQMNITQNQKTFAGFVRFATWFAVVAFTILILLALING